jgi:hypothetical protein
MGEKTKINVGRLDAAIDKYTHPYSFAATTHNLIKISQLLSPADLWRSHHLVGGVQRCIDDHWQYCHAATSNHEISRD